MSKGAHLIIILTNRRIVQKDIHPRGFNPQCHRTEDALMDFIGLNDNLLLSCLKKRVVHSLVHRGDKL